MITNQKEEARVDFKDPAVSVAYQTVDDLVSKQIGLFLQQPNSPASLTIDQDKWLRDQIRVAIQTQLGRSRDSQGGVRPLTEQEYQAIARNLYYDKHPLGALAAFFMDKDITEIRILGPKRAIVVAGDRKRVVPLSFKDEAELREKVVSFFSNRQNSEVINDSSPLGTLVTPTGDRCHVALPTVANTTIITIRRHQPDRFHTFDDLVDVGSMPPWAAEFLRGCLNARLNILVAGGVGAGKTTMLRIMGCEIPRDDRLGVIEDTRELFLEEVREGPDTFSLFTRSPNSEGRGEISLAVLLRNSLRMSPDRVFVGEVRGAEALYLVQAMSSGFYGSAGTIHAETAEDTLSQLLRYVALAPEAGNNMEMHMRSICEAIHLIVYTKRVRLADGSTRKVLDHVAAVIGYDQEGKRPRIERLFQFDERFEGYWRWVGPKLSDIGGAKWQERWAQANLDIDTLVPASIISEAHLTHLGVSLQ